MKLTTCQIAKLFPLLTAFFFLNSPSAASLSFGLSPTFASASSSLSLSPSSSSHFHSERPLRSDVLVLRAAKPVRAFATNADAATRPVPATAAATTLGSKSIWPTAIQTKSPRNAREAGRHKRQMQQPAIQQQPLQQQQQRINPPQQKRQQQQVQHKTQRVGVLIPASLHVDLTHVQQGFQNFLDFFQLHLFNVTVDFLRDVDLSGFIKLLELPKYTSVIKTLNAGIMVDSHVDVDQNSNMDIGTPSQPRQQHRLHSKQEQEPHRHHHQDSKAKQFPAGEEESHSSGETGENHWNDARSFSGHCHQLAEQLALDFNKTVFLWPCPRMKISSNFLPSFEAISLAVQSISTKLNWSQVDIYIGGLGVAVGVRVGMEKQINKLVLRL